MTTNISEKSMAVNVGEIVNETIDIQGLLKGTELATGTPLVEEVNTSDLTIANIAVNTATQIVDGRSVLAGEGIDFTISDFKVGKDYTLKITFSTDPALPATRVCYAKYEVCG